jgi:hypothetical protein
MRATYDVGEAEDGEREEVERRGWELFVGARCRLACVVDDVEEVALESVLRSRCCMCGGGAEYIVFPGEGEVEFVVVRE